MPRYWNHKTESGPTPATVEVAHDDIGPFIGVYLASHGAGAYLTPDESVEMICHIFLAVAREGEQLVLSVGGRTLKVTKNAQPAVQPLKWEYDILPESPSIKPSKS